MKKTYTQSVEEVLNDLGVGAEGLTTAQAQERLAKYGPNKLKEAEKPTLLQRFLAQLKDPMLIILMVAAAVSAVTGMLAGESEWAEVIIILLVVLLNAILGVIQESKAEAVKRMSWCKSCSSPASPTLWRRDMKYLRSITL